VAEYRLRFDRAILRQLDALPPDVRAVARRRVAQLAERPRPPDATELAAHPTYYRVWLPRGHRLVYRVMEDEEIVLLLYLGPKKPGLYEQLGLGREQQAAP
jgi:mRNA-degrading endonuclease RelE of RelBE toxin-antitoxin system